MSIATENQKQIREPMKIKCSLSAEITNQKLTYTVSAGTPSKVYDGNLQTHYTMRDIADLAGVGIPLDGSCELYDPTVNPSADNGKMGLRSHIGDSLMITISSSKEIPALTVAMTGSGTVTATVNGEETTYDIVPSIVISGGAKTITLVFANSSEDERFNIDYIVPGVLMEFDNENLTSCNLVLRSDLSLDHPSWGVSEIEIQAYYPEDISSAISSVGDNVPIIYSAGYDGDMSTTRKFYLSEKATMEKNIITIKGEDASARLEKTIEAKALTIVPKNVFRQLYTKMKNVIKSCGISISAEAVPPVAGADGSSAEPIIFEEQSGKDLIQNMMIYGHSELNSGYMEYFYPTFVDAGRPRVTWSYPTAKWSILEEDCGDVKREVERCIAKIKKDTSSSYPLSSYCQKGNARKTIMTTICEKTSNHHEYTKKFDGFYYSVKVGHSKITEVNASSVKFYVNKKFKKIETVKLKTPKVIKVKKKTSQKYKTGAKKGQYIYRTYTKTIKTKKVVKWVSKGKVVITGKQIYVRKNVNTITHNDHRAGYTLALTPQIHGGAETTIKGGGAMIFFPDYYSLMEKSNITGSFTWKGNPHMQPRDVFIFHRLGGTAETCTIETINLKHENGGTTAEITYRKGIV